MPRLVRRVLLVVVAVVLIGGAAALVSDGRDHLDTARSDTDATWILLRPPLDARYAAGGGLVTALTDAGAGDRDLVVEMKTSLARWTELSSARSSDIDAEVTEANRLEGLIVRAGALVAGSPRLSAVPTVATALGAVAAATVPAPGIQTYNNAARHYENERTAVWRRPVATLFGYQARPAFFLAGTPT